MLRKGNPPIPLVGTETGAASTENSMEGPQKTIELPYDPTIPFLGKYPEKNMVWKDKCTPIFIKPGHENNLNTEEWIKKM